MSLQMPIPIKTATKFVADDNNCGCHEDAFDDETIADNNSHGLLSLEDSMACRLIACAGTNKPPVTLSFDARASLFVAPFMASS